MVYKTNPFGITGIHLEKLLLKLIREHYVLLLIFLAPITIFIFTLGRYYGFYYDNHYFNLLALDLTEKLRPYFYLGSHYSIHSTLFSYILYPLFLILGATDVSMELAAGIFHLLTIFTCFKLGRRFYNQKLGLIFAALVAVSPMHIINIYTWQELSFIIFLNIASIYLFLSGFHEASKLKLIMSSMLYSLSCFQKIYSLLLLPFFIFYALFQVAAYLKNHKSIPPASNYFQKRGILIYISYILGIVAFLYFILLFKALFVRGHEILYYSAIALATFLSGLIFVKLPKATKEILKFCCLFFVITGSAIVLLDFLVQLDIHFFKQQFGYYRDATYAGGYGLERPALSFNGKVIKIFGKEVYSSLLSSLWVFRSFYTRAYSDLSEIPRTVFSYYQKCFPLGVNIFLIIGVAGLLVNMVIEKRKKNKLGIKYIFPLMWLAAALLSFVNANPFHIMRAYILPMPYLLAGLGVFYLAQITDYLFARLVKIRLKNPLPIASLAAAGLVLFLGFEQFNFAVNNIYKKYKHDKAHSMYYKLFHGWPYGRSYKEVGEFLLKDAPLKKDGKFRSILVYTIAPDTAVNICAIFFNTIDWYTQNKIKIVYDAKGISNIKYGSALSLARYLDWLFINNPDAQAIYFADFLDNKDNFSFFSRIHKDIKPYKIVNDDESTEYDCILYKFGRNTWRKQINGGKA